MALTTIDPTSALVVIDLQKGIVPALKDAAAGAAVVQHAAQLATAFRRRGLPVVLVNVTGGPSGRTDARRSGRGGGGGTGAASFPPEWSEFVDELAAWPRAR